MHRRIPTLHTHGTHIFSGKIFSKKTPKRTEEETVAANSTTVVLRKKMPNFVVHENDTTRVFT